MFVKAASFPILILSLLLTACSGNESSVVSITGDNLNVVVGLVHSGQAEDIQVQGVAVTVNGQLTVDAETGGLSGVKATTNSRGRYAIGLNYENESAIILFARGSDVTEETRISKIQCKLPLGCSVKDKQGLLTTVEFGEFYSPEFYYDYVENTSPDDDPLTNDEYEAYDTTLWSSGIEIAARGQFININAITDMAGAYGFSTYINNTDDIGSCDNTSCIQAPDFFSKYGIIKSNTQVADLIGLSDIISLEPANIAELDTISATTSATLQASIRYGALLAALQQIQLTYDNGLANQSDRRFRRELNLQFAQNQGQLYQAGGPAEQVLTKEAWFTTAKEILQAANTHFNALNKTLPTEVGSVISAFDADLGGLVSGEPTAAKATISASIAASYKTEIEFTKAMLNHLTVIADEFSNPDYRAKAKAYQKQLNTIGDEVSPAFNLISDSLFKLYGYYLSCTHATCDTNNYWHQFNGANVGSGFDAESKVLTLKYSAGEGDQLVVSQSVVDLDTSDAIDNPTESNAIDLIIEGILKEGDLTLITDFSEEKRGFATLRVSYDHDANNDNVIDKHSELQLDSILAVQNPSMPAPATPIYPRFYEFTFTTMKLHYKPTDPAKAANELMLEGAYSWLLRGVTNVRNSEEPRRYNLNNLTAVMNVEGPDLDGVEDDEVLADTTVISISASGFNSSNYYPDSTFPEIDNYFVPGSGHEFGESSGMDILNVEIIDDYQFPQIDAEGKPIAGAIVEGGVVPGKGVGVQVLRFNYPHSGSSAFIAYPLGDDGKYLGLLCTVTEVNDTYFDQGLISADDPEDQGGEDPENIFNCLSQDFYEGDANVNDYINQLWDLDPQIQNLIKAVNVRGEGVYFADFFAEGANEDDLPEFVSGTTYAGTMAAPATLGIDNIRLQIRPQLVKADNSDKLPEVAVDMNLVYPTRSSINVGLFVAYNPEQIINTENGLPIVAAGDDVESYYIAYKTTPEGNEIGEFVFNWYGAQLVDGGTEADYLQDYDAANTEPLENFLFNFGSDVAYGATNTEAGYTRCGLIFPGDDSDQQCDAIAYLTFRGFVTGTVRQERPGVYVARFINGDWMVLGN